MLFRLIFAFILGWLILTVIRAALTGAVPQNPGYRRYRSAGQPIAANRSKALATLGLYDGASGSEIKSAYKNLAAKYHPDRVAHLGPELEELTSEKFKEVQQAYDFLRGKG